MLSFGVLLVHSLHRTYGHIVTLQTIAYTFHTLSYYTTSTRQQLIGEFRLCFSQDLVRRVGEAER
jgi:hypothetical protein